MWSQTLSWRQVGDEVRGRGLESMDRSEQPQLPRIGLRSRRQVKKKEKKTRPPDKRAGHRVELSSKRLQ